MESTPHHGHPPHRRLAGLDPSALLTAALTPDPPLPPIPGLHWIRLLGRGGMGEVHLAHDDTLRHPVAVKLLHPHLTSEAVFLERLQREARIMAKLRHPGIVGIYRLEPLSNGSAAILMEFIEGPCLRRKLRSHPHGIPHPEALRLTQEIGRAIQTAHDAGVVHRDLKPENILLTQDGHAKVTDFGIAAPIDPLQTRLTLTGITTGTLDYLAPERHTSTEADPRSDLYSLGVILYEMLTGSLPRGNFDPPAALKPEIPRPLSEAVMQALKPSPDRRHPSVSAFLQAISPPRKRSSTHLQIPIAVLGLTSLAAWALLRPPTTPSPPTSPSVTTTWRNALPLSDLNPLTLSGSWKRETNALLSDSQISILRIDSPLPNAYRIRTRFTRLSGENSIALFFNTDAGTASVELDAWNLGVAGVQCLDGLDLRNQGCFPFSLTNGESHELIAEIHPEHVRILIDGEEKSITPIAGKTLSVASPWLWPPSARPITFAIGSWKSPTRFDSLEWQPLPET